MRFRLPRLLCLALIYALSLNTVYAWGWEGHQIVAIIAGARLSPAVRDKIRQLLMDGRYSLPQISACADIIRDHRVHEPSPDQEMCRALAGPVPADTGPWHYIDIPVPKFEKSLAQYCPEDNCVVAALKRFSGGLRNSSDPAKQRAALLFVVHFMGDIHQPLHCAERGCDHGGNSERVDFYLGDQELPNEALHKVWDTDLLHKSMADAHLRDLRGYADRLSASIDPDKAHRWASASIDDIAWESHSLAAKRVYRDIPFQDFCLKPPPESEPVELRSGYEKAGARTVREQIVKAGVRLAALLETAMRDDR